jgi:hypothetical protein
MNLWFPCVHSALASRTLAHATPCPHSSRGSSARVTPATAARRWCPHSRGQLLNWYDAIACASRVPVPSLSCLLAGCDSGCLRGGLSRWPVPDERFAAVPGANCDDPAAGGRWCRSAHAAGAFQCPRRAACSWLPCTDEGVLQSLTPLPSIHSPTIPLYVQATESETRSRMAARVILLQRSQVRSPARVEAGCACAAPRSFAMEQTTKSASPQPPPHHPPLPPTRTNRPAPRPFSAPSLSLGQTELAEALRAANDSLSERADDAVSLSPLSPPPSHPPLSSPFLHLRVLSCCM